MKGQLNKLAIPPCAYGKKKHIGATMGFPQLRLALGAREAYVLAACALGLTRAEFRTIYRIQAPVMRQYEADTWYDQRGRIVFANSKGLPGVGLPRAEWNEVKPLQTGTVTRTVLDTTLPTGPVERQIIYQAPFTKSDRENDYATMWGKVE